MNVKTTRYCVWFAYGLLPGYEILTLRFDIKPTRNNAGSLYLLAYMTLHLTKKAEHIHKLMTISLSCFPKSYLFSTTMFVSANVPPKFNTFVA